ncbi:MAG: peptidylprolyl isomerase [Deltaproteobacteria bacterium]
MKQARWALVTTLGWAVTAAVGCPKSEESKPKPEPTAAAQPDQPASASSMPADHDTSSVAVGLQDLFKMPKVEGDVVAKVEDLTVDKSALEARLRNIQVQLTSSGFPQGLTRYDVLDGALDDLIDEKLEIKLADKLGAKVDEKEVEAFLANLEERMAANPAFKTFLLRAGKDEKQRKLDAVDSVRRRAIVAKIRVEAEKEIEDAARDYYKRHERDFTQRGGVATWRIMIKAPRGMEQRSRDAARARAESIHAKAKKSPDDFENLARTHSEGGKRNEGGFIGYVGEKQFNEKFTKVVYAGKPGEVLPLYEDARGFQILKVGKRRETRLIPFEEKRGEIMENVYGTVIRQQIRKRLDKLRAEHKIEILVPEYHELAKKLSN